MPTTNNSSKKGKNTITCNYCKKKGHKEENCFRNPKSKQYKGVNSTSSLDNSNSTTSSSTNNIVLTTKESKNNLSTIEFILDSGATVHTCYLRELFTSIKPTSTSIKQGNSNSLIKARGIGDIEVKFTSINNLVTIKNVLYILELGLNLLSLNLITSKNYTFYFNKDSCYLRSSKNTLIAKGCYKEGVSTFSAISSKYLDNSTSNTKLRGILNTIEENNSSNKEESIVESIEEVEENNFSIEDKEDLEDIYNLEEYYSKTKAKSSNNSSTKSNSSKEEVLEVNNNTIELWHNRLGHIAKKAIEYLPKVAKGVTLDPKDSNLAKTSLDSCITCI